MSNLVQAQQAYTLVNATKLGVQVDAAWTGTLEGKGAQAQAGQQVLFYDNTAAERRQA